MVINVTVTSSSLMKVIYNWHISSEDLLHLCNVSTDINASAAVMTICYTHNYENLKKCLQYSI